MITIQAGSVAELKKIFTDMFGAPVVASIPVEAKPEARKSTPPKKEEAKKETTPAPETIQVEVPESGGRECTYEEVMDKVKALKASTIPDILERVTEWKTKGNHPALKTADALTLGLAMTFIESLEVGNVPF